MAVGIAIPSPKMRLHRAFEVSLQSGIPVIKGINISLPIVNEVAIRNRLIASQADLEAGESLSRSFKKTEIFPVFALNLIKIGEESGNLTEALSEIADSFEADCEDAINVMISLIEPVMILAVGLIVGLIVGAVLLPIFQINVIQM
jgi:type II secretory pathway component PulF